MLGRTHLNDETKTHEDDDDPGVVPIIEPLRVVLEAIKPEIASGWMFPNRIGGALDLDNLADRVIKPVLKSKRSEVERLARLLPGPRHESPRTRSAGQSDPSNPAPRRCQHDAEELYQDRAEGGDGRHEATGSKNSSCSRCAAGLGELIVKLLKGMEPTTRVELVTCRLRIGCSTN